MDLHTAAEVEKAWLTREAERYRSRTVEERLDEFKTMLDIITTLARTKFPPLLSDTPPNLPWWPLVEPASPSHDDQRR